MEKITDSEKLRFKKISSFVFEKTLFNNTILNMSEEALKKILLSDILKLFIATEINVDEEILRAFNTIVNFISDNKDYVVAICVCVKIKSVLQYKISNTHSRLNKLMTIIAKLKSIH